MTKRPVLVTHGVFTLRGQQVSRGTVISDPEDMAFVQANHPEKVTRTMHDFADAPAPAMREPEHADE